jgi:hypothetical protein
MPSEEGEYSAMGDGEDDDAIQEGGDNPAMAHVATGRVFEVQRQVFCTHAVAALASSSSSVFRIRLCDESVCLVDRSVHQRENHRGGLFNI